MPNDTRRQWIGERTAVLEAATGPEELETAATELASSDDPEALEALAVFLRQNEFLDRLDEPGSYSRLTHLSGVMTALIAAPSPEVARLCLDLVDEPVYLEHDRKSFVLQALAAVPQMEPETAEAFRRANQEGYFGFDALLLAANSSLIALRLFRSMMAQKEVEPEVRVELLHKGIMPNRTRLTILQTVSAMMDDDLEEPVAAAAIESVFDYQAEWFKIHGPTPPSWRIASNEVLQYVIELGDRARRRPDLPPSLPPAIRDTVEIARALLKARAA